RILHQKLHRIELLPAPIVFTKLHHDRLGLTDLQAQRSRLHAKLRLTRVIKLADVPHIYRSRIRKISRPLRLRRTSSHQNPAHQHPDFPESHAATIHRFLKKIAENTASACAHKNFHQTRIRSNQSHPTANLHQIHPRRPTPHFHSLPALDSAQLPRPR